TVQRRLVQQLAPELMEADVDNRSSESLVRHHAFDVQVLDPDHAGSLHQTAGGLVQPVSPKVGDASVQSAQFPSVLTPIAASFYLPAVLTGQPPQTAEIRLQSLRTFQLLAAGEPGHRSHAEVHARRRLALADRGGPLHFDGNRNKPPASHTADGGRKWFSGEAQPFPHLHPAHDGQADSLALEFECAGAVVQTRRGFPAFFPKARIAAMLSEKPLKRSATILDGLLRHRLGYPQHPRKLLPLDAVEFPPQGRFVWLLACFALAPPFLQSPVVGEPRHPHGLPQQSFLSLGRNKRDAMGERRLHWRTLKALTADIPWL